MTCASCVNRVEKAIASVEGARNIRVNLANEQASVSLHEDTRHEDIIHAVQAAGYDATPLLDDASPHDDSASNISLRQWKYRAIVGITLSIPIMALSMGATFPGSLLVVAALTTIVVLYTGTPFLLATLRTARYGHATMDTLITLGAGTAFLCSFWSLWNPEASIYFESAAMILSFIALGKYLELRARNNASSAIKKLLQLEPDIAHRIGPDGETDIPATDVQSGDRLRIRPGERIPVDGTIVSGSTTIDESMLTGESIPAEKSEGSPVFAGTLLQTHLIEIEATQTGHETVLHRIIQTVQQAQESKANVQRLADRISAVFVPIILLIALLTFASWTLVLSFGGIETALMNTVAVLIIACPCALGLATPTAIMAATSRGAQLGILIRNAQAIEQSSTITDVVFDKTGTLTEGKPSVVHVEAAPSAPEAWLTWAAAVEQHSNHPLAHAITRYVQQSTPALPEASALHETHGRGIEATVAGHTITLGSEVWASDSGHAISTLPAPHSTASSVYCSIDGTLAGRIDLHDAILPESHAVIAELQRMGLTVHLLSGDRAPVANAIAKELHITNVIAEVLPDEKAEAIRSLRNEKRTVAMVGDGINDAPALAEAHLGIAMGHGSDIAIESGDLVLLRNNPGAVAQAVRLSRNALRTIHQNLFWAFFYNTCAVPAAALGFLNPMVAAAAMALSSVSVVSNSLRLMRFR